MTCTYWCSEVSASFFRTAFTNSHGKKGDVAFGEKGHEVHDKRRISIGLRWTFLLSWSHGKHQGRPKYNMHLFQMFSGRLINKSLLVGNSNFLLFLLSLTLSYSSSLVIIIVLRDSSLVAAFLFWYCLLLKYKRTAVDTFYNVNPQLSMWSARNISI